MAGNNKTAATPSPKRRGGGKKALFALMITLVAFYPTACVLLSGMLPTLVAMFTDRDRDKSLAFTMGATNFAGVLPFVLDLWGQGQSFEVAVRLLLTPVHWLVMYGAAAAGWMIYLIVPPMVANIMALMAATRIQKLRSYQDDLKKNWGQDVENNKQFDEFGNEIR